MRVTIEAAEDGEIAAERGDIFRCRIIDADSDDIVLSSEQQRSHIETKRGEIAPVRADQRAVHKHVRFRRRTIEFQEQTLTDQLRRRGEMTTVPCRAAI